MAQGGLWLCLDDVNRAPPAVLQLITQSLVALQTALRAKKEMAMLPGASLPCLLKAHFALFATTTTGAATPRTPLWDNLRELCRTTHVMSPSIGVALEAFLAARGFAEPHRLAASMAACIALCESLQPGDGAFATGLSLSSSRHIVTLAYRMLRTVHASGARVPDAERACGTALAVVLGPRLAPDARPTLLAALSQHFPSLQASDTSPDFLAAVLPLPVLGLTDAMKELKLVPTPQLEASARELQHAMTAHRAVMVVGPVGAGKTTVIRVRGPVTHAYFLWMSPMLIYKFNVAFFNRCNSRAHPFAFVRAPLAAPRRGTEARRGGLRGRARGQQRVCQSRVWRLWGGRL